jgi:hypothetical protein
MRRLVALVAVGGIVVGAVVVATRSFGTETSSAAAARCLPGRPPTAVGETVQWGHIKSLTRKGRRFELRFDPAWWLSGVTAQRAAVADKVVRPGEPVPNDYYVVDESHRLLTYLVPTSARVTVLTNATCATPIAVSELAQIVRGRNPKRRPLYDRGNHLGYWIRIKLDTIRSLDQQYQP